MAEEKVEPRETNWRHLLPWTELFRGFQVALDLNKLALAAAGIVVMAVGWWLLALLFRAGENAVPPQWPGPYAANVDKARAWEQFKQERDHWNLMHESAGLGAPGARVEPTDLTDSLDEYESYEKARKSNDVSTDEFISAVKARADAAEALKAATTGKVVVDEANVAAAQKQLAEADERLSKVQLGSRAKYFKENHIPGARAAALASMSMGDLGKVKPYAVLNTWPWLEDRGPNPFLMATGQLGKPWEVGHFWEWFLTHQGPVLIEPIVKLLLPVVYFFSPGADLKCRLYFLCVLIWTVATWAIFGGAITRIAAVQVARGDKIGMVDALRFTFKRILSYLTAPLFPLLFVFVLLIAMILFGLPFMIPIFGDIFVAGLFWPVMLVVGLLMAIALVGLVGWPLMSATISAEGTDSWEAVSRAYSYVYQRPWHFLWYFLVALVYGAVVVFFIGFMGSLTIYLAKWGVSQTPGISYVGSQPNGRKPDFLFVYAPDSFGWRPLLLKGAVVDGEKVVDADGQINPTAYNKWVGNVRDYNGPDRLQWWNLIGAGMVAFWLGLVFLLILGFSYSYFWSASTIVYMLLRRNVDAAEMDEVYLDEDDGDGAGAFGGPLTPPAVAPTAAAKPGAQSLTLVDAPASRPAATPTAPPPRDDGGMSPRSEIGTGPVEPRP
ncbi:MAG TPA: hypothetical protein DDY78_11565 [Planctomycetales bacterium]|jgi:hypothetical protein|nr:hypothetical protein [Planctomycetales bacterium]